MATNENNKMLKFDEARQLLQFNKYEMTRAIRFYKMPHFQLANTSRKTMVFNEDDLKNWINKLLKAHGFATVDPSFWENESVLLFKREDLIKLLNIKHPSLIYYYIHHYNLPYIKMCDSTRFPVHTTKDWIENVFKRQKFKNSLPKIKKWFFLLYDVKSNKKIKTIEQEAIIENTEKACF